MGEILKRRFYSKQELKEKDQIISLDPAESHHLANVLRVETHERFRVFDAKNSDWYAQIERIDSHGNVAIRLIEQNEKKLNAAWQLSVAQALPQRGKMDIIVEKAAELGVHRVLPMITDRTIVKITSEQRQKVLNRWEKIIREASKQSLSRISTAVSEPQNYENILNQAECNEMVLLDPSGIETLSKVIARLKNKLADGAETSILLLIGPEGGFSDREIKKAKDKKMVIASMGESVLKTDTAFVAAVGAIQAGLYE